VNLHQSTDIDERHATIHAVTSREKESPKVAPERLDAQAKGVGKGRLEQSRHDSTIMGLSPAAARQTNGERCPESGH
jgi:hypothetical protein